VCMPTPRIIQFDEDDQVVCPICRTLIVDEDEGMVEQPSCPHTRFIYCNGEAFEHDPEGLELRLEEAREEADEKGECFDEWDWLLGQCDEGDVILEQNTQSMACGPVSFKVWIGIRGEAENSKSRHPGGRTFPDEYSARDNRIFFRPTRRFAKWMKAHHSGRRVYEVGCGVGNTASMLAKAGVHVTAIDLEPRIKSEFDVIKADGTGYAFEKGSVLLFCRPCHDHDFVRNTILRGLCRGVRAVVYVGLQRNVRADLGGYFKKFVQRRIAGIGHSDERIWEMKVSRLSANAHLRRGAIPPLSD